MTDAAFQLTVYGTPAPAGSKRAFAIKRGGVPTGRIAISDASKRSRPWKDLISQAAGPVMGGRALLDCALAVSFTFYVRRPKGHYSKRGGLLPSAPPFPTVKPDVLKLARAVEDALSGVVYRDDSQIVTEHLVKRYGEPERVELTITTAGDQ